MNTTPTWLKRAFAAFAIVIACISSYGLGNKIGYSSGSRDTKDRASIKIGAIEQEANETNDKLKAENANTQRLTQQLNRALYELQKSRPTSVTEADRLTKEASQEQGRLNSKINELQDKIKAYESDFAGMQKHYASIKEQADKSAKVLSDKTAADKAARQKRDDIRTKASDDAKYRLIEYAATTTDSTITTQALITLRQINIAHNDGVKAEITDRPSILRECAYLIRLGGDVIPAGSKYTFEESWKWHLLNEK